MVAWKVMCDAKFFNRYPFPVEYSPCRMGGDELRVLFATKEEAKSFANYMFRRDGDVYVTSFGQYDRPSYAPRAVKRLHQWDRIITVAQAERLCS